MKKLSGFIILSGLTLASCRESITDKNSTQFKDSTIRAEKHIADTSDLYKSILIQDSLLFNEGFNKLDTAQVASLICDDFEFYHDEHGVTETKSDFVSGIASIKELPFKTWRVLKTETSEVFPMYSENRSVLYGAIQNGVHEFYQQKEGEEARKSSTARFSHLWIKENGIWKLKRVFSYNHK